MVKEKIMTVSMTLEQDLHCLSCLEQLGEFENALNGYRTVLGEVPGNEIATFRYKRLLRDLRSDEVKQFHLVWQVDSVNGGQWEVDWIRQLLAGLAPQEVIDGEHNVFIDGSIIVDHTLSPQKNEYYFEMLKRGHRFAIIHLSDEQYKDDWSAYEYANCIVRQYWSPLIADRRNILAMPLGCKNGFVVNNCKPAGERRFVWSFIGAVNRSSRPAMISAMRSLPGGFEHTTGLGNVDPGTLDQSIVLKPWMSIVEYAALLEDTIFSPCPIGMQNLDSFRVCESLEAGCIPIVERRPNHDYFSHLYGSHPMVTVDCWDQVPMIIAALMNDPVALEAKRMQCKNWWSTHRKEVIQRVENHILNHFKGRLQCHYLPAKA
jgi:hypothetical protein